MSNIRAIYKYIRVHTSKIGAHTSNIRLHTTKFRNKQVIYKCIDYMRIGPIDLAKSSFYKNNDTFETNFTRDVSVV